jgi:hypothetical protein
LDRIDVPDTGFAVEGFRQTKQEARFRFACPVERIFCALGPVGGLASTVLCPLNRRGGGMVL